VIHDKGPCDVNLPAEPVDRHDIIIKDGSNNAATPPITVHAASGTTIDEWAPSLAISTNNGWVRLIYAETIGRRWLRIGRMYGSERIGQRIRDRPRGPSETAPAVDENARHLAGGRSRRTRTLILSPGSRTGSKILEAAHRPPPVYLGESAILH
jgi:hypothetical protein